MSNAIQFLEDLGRSATWGKCPAEAHEDAIDSLQIDENQKRMLLERDHHALNRVLGGRAMMAMHVATPDGEEAPQEEPFRHDDEGEESPEEPPAE